MVRTIVIPEQNNVLLSMPDAYIGKTIEITFLALDELSLPSQKTLGDFAGLLSLNDYQQLKDHTQQARSEWDRNF
jgi:hypothetical protein